MRGSDRHGKGSWWQLPLPMTLLPTSWLVGVRGAGYGVPESYPPWAWVAGPASRSSQRVFARVFAGVKPLDAPYIDATGDAVAVSFIPYITLLPGNFPITTATRFSTLGCIPGLTTGGINCLGPVPGRLQICTREAAVFLPSGRRYY